MAIVAGLLAFGSFAVHAGDDKAKEPVPAAAAPAPAPDTGPAPAPGAAPAIPQSPLANRISSLAGVPSRAGVNRDDWGAIAAFYSERHGDPIWVGGEGYTARGQQAVAEIRRADDWGLEARAYDLPETNLRKVSPEGLAGAEIKISIAVLKYARQARGGRINPSDLSPDLDQSPKLRDPKRVMREIATASGADSYLRSLHPKHPQFVLLRQALLRARGRHVDASGDAARLAAKGRNRYSENDRTRIAGREDKYDDQWGDDPYLYDDGSTGDETLPWGRPAGDRVPNDIRRILVNMERWRWMPDDLGDFYVWDNVPEFVARVVKNGNVIHTDKIIVGKPNTPTPVFSARMQSVVFHPEWAVPDSIKVNELLPHLRYEPDFFGMGGGTDTSILRQHNLRVVYNGQPVDPRRVDWGRVDIRQFQFLQAPGEDNVLGSLKFRFPNKHDVYMHDTPERNLFARSERALSHGCMRVQDPRRLAEIILGEDKGWSASQVGNLLATGYNSEVELTHSIPVHVTYLTMVANPDGSLRNYPDVYGYDEPIASALEGRPARIVRARPTASDDVADDEQPRRRSSGGIDDLFSILLGF